MAAAGLLAGGTHGQAPHASALTAGSRYAAQPAAGGTRHRAGALPAAGALPVKDVAQATHLAGLLRGVRRYLRTRQGVAQIALFNKAADRTYLLTGGPDTQYTASIVKADIMALWLWRYQSRTGTIPDNMPYSIRYLLQNMITKITTIQGVSQRIWANLALQPAR